MSEPRAPHHATQQQIRKIRRIFWVVAVIAIVLSVFMYVRNLPPPAGKYDAFAECIAHTSTTFYGAFWCPHCLAQKQEFGDASKYLPYVECSTPDTLGELPICKNVGVTEYPTWVFPDHTTGTGELTLQVLSEKTGCPLPTSS